MLLIKRELKDLWDGWMDGWMIPPYAHIRETVLRFPLWI